MDKQVKNWWAQFEKALDTPQHLKTRQDEIIRASGWTAGVNGDLPGVFADKRRGSRALWSIRWATAHGVLSPDEWMPLDFMTLAQLKAEVLDNVWTNPTDYNVGRLTRQLLELEYEPHSPEYWRSKTIDFLLQARIGYTDFAAPWDCPSMGSETFRLMRLNIRPGWGLKEDYGF